MFKVKNDDGFTSTMMTNFKMMWVFQLFEIMEEQSGELLYFF